MDITDKTTTTISYGDHNVELPDTHITVHLDHIPNLDQLRRLERALHAAGDPHGIHVTTVELHPTIGETGRAVVHLNTIADGGAVTRLIEVNA